MAGCSLRSELTRLPSCAGLSPTGFRRLLSALLIVAQFSCFDCRTDGLAFSPTGCLLLRAGSQLLEVACTPLPATLIFLYNSSLVLSVLKYHINEIKQYVLFASSLFPSITI